MIIHLIAKHPVGALAVGTLALSAYVTAPLGPAVPLGADGIIEKREAAMLSARPELKTKVDLALEAFKEVQGLPLPESAIAYVIENCPQCKGTSSEWIRGDEMLTKDVKWLYFLDLSKKHGVEEAKVLYKAQR